MNIISLSNWDVAAMAVFVLLNGAISLWLRLGIERQLLVASLRMVAQLAVVAAILTALFELASLGWTLLMALTMVLFASREIVARQQHRLSGWWGYGLGGAMMAFSTSAVTLFALLVSLRPDPLYDPRYVIPLFGMVLGNAMTAISLGLDTMTEAAIRQRNVIEARIALGASRFVALRPVLRDAMRRGLIPTINAMAASGIIALPGMMTGQILAGVPPEEAVRYQLLIMFMITGATGLGLLIAVYGAAWRMTDKRHRLRSDRIEAANQG